MRARRRLLLIPAVGLVLVGGSALGLGGSEPGRPTTTRVALAPPTVAPTTPGATVAPEPTATTEPAATTAPTAPGATAPTTTATTATTVPASAATVEGTATVDGGGTGGWQATARVEADLVGITWAGDPAVDFGIEVRSGDGPWRDAGRVAVVDIAPDDGTGDAVRALRTRRAQDPNASEPLWVGDADAVRVSVGPGSVGAVTLVAVASADATAPSGAAGAAGAIGPLGPGRTDGPTYAVALVGLGLGLGAVALSRRPRSLRRPVALVVVAGAFVAGAPVAAGAATPAQPSMISHSQWGPDLGWNPSPDCAPGPAIAGHLKFAVVHHTVNANGYGPGDSVGIVRAIWAYHVGTLGYCDIAYNFLVDRYGQILEGRAGGIDKAVIAAHTGGFNTGSTGVAWIGDFSSETPPPAAQNAVVDLLAWKLSVHRVNPSAGFTTVSLGGGSHWPAGTSVSFANAIVGHRDLWPTACPGNAGYSLLGPIRTAVQPRISWPADVDVWEPLGGVLRGAPAVTAWSAGRLDVFARGSDDQLWHKWYDSGWSGWEPLGGVLSEAPAVASWSAGRLDIFAKGSDDQLWHKWYDRGWSGWEPLGGVLSDAPTVAAWSAGRLDVFVKGSDDQLWHKWYDRGWSGWEPLGGGLSDAPSAASWSAGRLDVFIRGTDSALWHKWYESGWSGWEYLGGQFVDAPAAASWTADEVDVFVRQPDGKVVQRWFQLSWSDWMPLSGSLVEAPAVASWEVGRWDLFGTGSDQQLWHKWYQGRWGG